MSRRHRTKRYCLNCRRQLPAAQPTDVPFCQTCRLAEPQLPAYEAEDPEVCPPPHDDREQTKPRTEEHLSRQQRRQRERLRRKAFARQPYITRVSHEMEAQPDRFPPGTVSLIDVHHDDWCPRPHGGLCRCSPEIEWVIVLTPGAK